VDGPVSATASYRIVRVPVRGGELTCGAWGPEDAADTVLAIHGITATHLSWPLLAERLDGVRVVAPDLRGRGRSNAAPPPWGMTDHADDMARVLDAVGVGEAVVVGHSMGGFVAGWLAAGHPDRVGALVLVDGGLPLPIRLPEGVPAEDAPALLLGPAGERLRRVYASREAYRSYWRAHPAFARDWSPVVEAYVDYDLEPVGDGFRPGTRLEAVAANIVQMDGAGGYREALGSLRMPVDFLRAPRGLLDEAPGLYPPAVLRAAAAALPGVRLHELDDVNHYGVVLTRAGAAQVAPFVHAALAVPSDEPPDAGRTETA
jgi:pimeloyl-ACP methyl ester carboxylesterase